jgi:hypothetical protein
MRDLVRRFGPARLGVLAVMVTGAVLLLLALAFGTIGARPSVTTVRVVGQAGAPVVVTTAEALALDGPSVRVDVKGPDPAKPVFVGVGREGDVAAYLGGAARTEVTGVDGDRAVSSRTGSDSSLPEPTGVDVWALSATGRGSATLTWPQAPGRWRLVAAVDGATPPAQVVISWQRDRGGSPVPVLLAVGALLLVLGFVGSRVIGRNGPRPAATPAPDGAPAPGAVPPPTPTAPPAVRVSGRRRADRADGALPRGARDVGALHENALDHEPVAHGSLAPAHPDRGHPDDGLVDAGHSGDDHLGDDDLGDDDLDDDAEEAPAVPAPFRRPQSPSAGGAA